MEIYSINGKRIEAPKKQCPKETYTRKGLEGVRYERIEYDIYDKICVAFMVLALLVVIGLVLYLLTKVSIILTIFVGALIMYCAPAYIMGRREERAFDRYRPI